MRWDPGILTTDCLAVHAALLHSGEILFFTGNEFWGFEHENNLYDHVRSFDCATSVIARIPVPPNMTDLFCCGHSLMGNGNIMIAGGTKDLIGPAGSMHNMHWIGEKRTWLFDASLKSFYPWTASLNTNAFQPLEERSGGRWYPTLVTLGSGQIIAFGGHPDKNDSRHSNDTPEYFEWNKWSFAGGRDHSVNFPNMGEPLEYPRIHLLPNGKLFSSTPFYDESIRVPHRVMQYNFGIGWEALAHQTPDHKDWRAGEDHFYRIYNQFNGTSVLLPLLPEKDYVPEIMVHGNINSYKINLSATNPAWEIVPARPLSKRRLTVNAVLLPTGEIFFGGGVEGITGIVENEETHYLDSSGVMEAEIYNPATGTWALSPPAQVVRNYHSVALLMPDGRVWTAGSSKNHRENRGSTPEIDHRELRIEIFEPWYYGLVTRPRITNIASENNDIFMRPGQAFTVRCNKPEDIQRVAIIRNGSVTHGFNSDQRYIGLSFSLINVSQSSRINVLRTETVLKVSIPGNANLVVPGYYLLFLIDKNGVPSEGKFINIDVGWSEWEAGQGDGCTSSAAVTSTRKNKLEVFVKRVHSENIWQRSFDSDGWGNWQNHGGPFTSAPAAISRVGHSLDLFAKGVDDAIWHKRMNLQSEGSWNNLGGSFSSGPAVASWKNNRMDLFARGMDNALYHKYWQGAGWSEWESLGGVLRSAPCAVSWGPNRIDCFALGSDNAVWFRSWDGNAWTNWDSLGGNFILSPAVSSYRPDRLDVFAVNSDHHLWHRWWDGNAWNNWEDLGGSLAYPPGAWSPYFNRIDIFGVNSAGNLLHKYWWE